LFERRVDEMPKEQTHRPETVVSVLIRGRRDAQAAAPSGDSRDC
jgi:hypothetical protein